MPNDPSPLYIPFIIQFGLVIAAFLAALLIARRSQATSTAVCIASFVILLFWPLLRFFPVRAVDLLGAPFLSCIELTGMAVPAALLFPVASRRLPKRSDQRAVLMLTAVAAVYFVNAGWWMISPGVPPLKIKPPEADGVCRQSTGYTCVAASMVTLLRARGVEADEREMARLAYTQVDGGATDSRALWALQTKLRGSPLHPRYQHLDRAGLIAATKPCMVQLNWGYFISHMVPVMSATDETVVIGDPLSGPKRLSMDEFLRQWKRMAITIESDSPEPAAAPAIPDEELKRAMTAFRKRLKLTRLDQESRLGGGRPTTSGKVSDIAGILPPNQFPTAVWKELAARKQLKDLGRGFYGLP